MGEEPHPFSCPHCAQQLISASADRLRASTKVVVIHKSGQVEINCSHCRRGVYLPLVLEAGAFTLRKAERSELRFVLTRSGATPQK